MPQVKFYCPDCAFSKEISRSDIPENSTQCKCPSCRKIFAIEDAIQPLEEAADSSLPDAEVPVQEEVIAAEPEPEPKTEEDKGISTGRYYELFDDAMTALNANNELEALHLLEEAEKISSTPKLQSALAYCRAKARNQFTGAVRICMESINAEPTQADHYLHLGRIYLLGGKRGPALKAFRKGIKLGPHPQLMRELRRFELRRSPVFSSLSRDHFLNRNLGKLLGRLRLR
ncbi:hypothetical protein SAMN02745165_01245 [Malonomonas rubra DSM 5091]|uniref:Uncharacterized protein n=1 Tax=Malonomonas rubra DSM 5091 TaxID=1122189 RepID=A0A1M6FD72_MALRU|nr:hypothetical protein [Malonomonas rubra]SHI95621.1 hypothetical protein SAMN02745165_01245 [Malonomonas rubra DSM 5091]